jgi:hypothetical protein
VEALVERGPEAQEEAGKLLEDIVLRTPFGRGDLILEYARSAPPELFFSALEEAVRQRHYWVAWVPGLFNSGALRGRGEITADPRWDQLISEVLQNR